MPENYTFFDLHEAIQAVMSWDDYHLHEFEMLNPKTGKLDRIGAKGDDYDYFGDESLVLEKKTKLSDYFTLENKDALYTYDFGDNWQVKVKLEKILPKIEGGITLSALKEKEHLFQRTAVELEAICIN